MTQTNRSPPADVTLSGRSPISGLCVRCHGRLGPPHARPCIDRVGVCTLVHRSRSAPAASRPAPTRARRRRSSSAMRSPDMERGGAAISSVRVPEVSACRTRPHTRRSASSTTVRRVAHVCPVRASVLFPCFFRARTVLNRLINAPKLAWKGGSRAEVSGQARGRAYVRALTGFATPPPKLSRWWLLVCSGGSYSVARAMQRR